MSDIQRPEARRERKVIQPPKWVQRDVRRQTTSKPLDRVLIRASLHKRVREIQAGKVSAERPDLREKVTSSKEFHAEDVIRINIFKGDGSKVVDKITDLEGNEKFLKLPPELQDLVKKTQQITSDAVKKLIKLTKPALDKGSTPLEEALKETGEDFNTLGRWTQKYLERITRNPRSKTWPMAFGYAVEEISQKKMVAQDLKTRFNLEFNQTAPSGLVWHNARKGMRPDAFKHSGNGKGDILDWTAVEQSGKILKYTSNGVEYLIEILHTTPTLP